MSQSNALSQVSARKFIVGTVDTNGYFSVSSRPFFHPSMSDALAESKRLAVKYPGKAFVPMQLVGGAMQPAVPSVQTF